MRARERLDDLLVLGGRPGRRVEMRLAVQCLLARDPLAFGLLRRAVHRAHGAAHAPHELS